MRGRVSVRVLIYRVGYPGLPGFHKNYYFLMKFVSFHRNYGNNQSFLINFNALGPEIDKNVVFSQHFRSETFLSFAQAPQVALDVSILGAKCPFYYIIKTRKTRVFYLRVGSDFFGLQTRVIRVRVIRAAIPTQRPH